MADGICRRPFVIITIISSYSVRNTLVWGDDMKGAVEERAIELGEYILQNNATVRAAAKRFHISKSTVHKDVSERLQTVNPQLYGEVRHVLEVNKAQRHIRGGMATRRKYKGNP